MTLTFKEFSAANRARCESPQGFNHALASWSTSDWFLAALGELGEAANIAKKLNRVRDGIPGNRETPDELHAKLRHELGDVFVYLDLLAQALGFNIGDAAVEVFNAKSVQIGYVAQGLGAASDDAANKVFKLLMARAGRLERALTLALVGRGDLKSEEVSAIACVNSGVENTAIMTVIESGLAARDASAQPADISQ